MAVANIIERKYSPQMKDDTSGERDAAHMESELSERNRIGDYAPRTDDDSPCAIVQTSGDQKQDGLAATDETTRDRRSQEETPSLEEGHRESEDVEMLKWGPREGSEEGTADADSSKGVERFGAALPNTGAEVRSSTSALENVRSLPVDATPVPVSEHSFITETKLSSPADRGNRSRVANRLKIRCSSISARYLHVPLELGPIHFWRQLQDNGERSSLLLRSKAPDLENRSLTGGVERGSPC